MNKKETLEIRKLFMQESSCLTRICSCYVDFNKEKVCTKQDAFLSLAKDEALKYNDIFKATLSGTIGKNLLNMEFPTSQEMPGGTQEFLMQLRASELKDATLVEAFYDKVIAGFQYPENYYIILIYGAYDVPGRASDGAEMYDASEEVYQFLLCSICPVNRSKGGLSYLPESNIVGERVRDWVVEPPMKGFLFPAFNDRGSDIHNVLYYTKNPEDSHPEFTEQVLGSVTPMTPVNQKETFQSIIMNTLGDEADYEVVSAIHENLNEMIAETKNNPDPLTLTKHEMKNLLEISGVPNEELQEFEHTFEEIAGPKAALVASNLTNTKKLSIETPDIIIKVNSDRTDLIQTQYINGRQCFVITVDDHVEINGMNVRTMRSIKDESTDNQS
ncbi:MAG: DUF4317 domain-containing protein [Lachnospiraceae bacterium]|nr:DUF4317 domain-containing protein [Lachnospiraceae bacterium]